MSNDHHQLFSMCMNVTYAFARDLMGGAGFEPAKAMPSDLQSDPFDRSGNPPVQPCTHDPCDRKSTFEPITVLSSAP